MTRETMEKLRSRGSDCSFNQFLTIWGYMCFLLSLCDSYNLDVDNSLSFRGPNGSLFGYSVLLHEHKQERWLVAGAPVDDSVSESSMKKTGAIYKCSISDRTCQRLHLAVQACGRTCTPEHDNQWLGVSLARQPGQGRVLACGHRWKNVYYAESQNKLPHGVCFRLDSDLAQSSQLIPCYRDHQRKFGESYGSCQAGISTFLTEDLIIMGAPGTTYWTGSVLVYNTSSNVLAAYINDEDMVQVGSYLGYSVSAGHFHSPHSTEIVGGAPQDDQTGKAYIFTVEGNTLQIIKETKGKMLGSYFGASVCAVDLNADGWSDLLVGSPMYSIAREEGRVYVYINQGEADMKEAEFELTGSNLYAARFGEAIMNLGDIDDDGFPDVAIGAPQEEELVGAIYIYNGRKNGIAQTFSQRITGTMLGNDLKMFGQSVSGGIDVDGNSYPDVAVGAFLSNSAVILRTRPVLRVEAYMLLPPSVNRSITLCAENGQPTVCLNVTVCFKVKGKHVPGLIELRYNLTADVQSKESFSSRFYFSGNGTSNVTTGRVKAKHEKLICATHQAFMRRDVRNLFTPIRFGVQYELGDHSVARTGTKALRPLTPVLQQRDGHSTLVTNTTVFARYCAWENCSTNLQVSAVLVLPWSHGNMKYFALGSGKTIMLNTTLVNAGDDAFLPKLHLRFPNNLHFIKVLDAEEKYVSCEVTEENDMTTEVDCSVGNLYIASLSKVNVSFLLDVDQSSSAGDISISINATRENYENEDLLYDNVLSLTMPLKYGVGLSVHGFTTPSTFMFGEPEPALVDCHPEKLNFTYKVMNIGPSKALNAKAEIRFPHVLVPSQTVFLEVTNVQSTHGHCNMKNHTELPDEECHGTEFSFMDELFFFVSKSTKRIMYCDRENRFCAVMECSFGNLDSGKEVTVHVEVELNPAALWRFRGRHDTMLLESYISITSPKNDSHTVLIQEDLSATFILEAQYKKELHPSVGIFIIVMSSLMGLIILIMIVVALWKCGFFKRKKEDSWDYVPK
ncbi:integrin alpha-4 [Chanos chanos]|uniref:Integrin alpha-4 n=1 Tax=Chanos chanos TaxID=29144 RepID=A0A6J2WEA0_CHACN|nr:integrin alpha-4 [Chanos chanos]